MAFLCCSSSTLEDVAKKEDASLFDELHVPLLKRPSVEQLRLLWDELDQDQNDVLTRDELMSFLSTVSRNWGDGSWKNDSLKLEAVETGLEPPPIISTTPATATNERAQPSQNAPSRALLDPPQAEWPTVIQSLWGSPVFGISSTVVVLMQYHFLEYLAKERTANGTTTTDQTLSVDASLKLTKELLDSMHAPPQTCRELVGSISNTHNKRSTQEEKTGVTFAHILQTVGPTLAKYSNEKVGIRHTSADGDLPLHVAQIESFAPVRSDVECQILNCGEATMTAMLHAIKGAQSEIMMSWWEFCPTYPAIRNAKLGNNAWDDEHGGTLRPILMQKAEAGCQVYILLYDIVDRVNGTAELVEYVIANWGRAHPNIHVVKHPGWNVWTESAHQKFVVVDRSISILGGVDWTLHRWDTPDHPIFDPDSAVRPGIDMIKYSPQRFKEDISEWWTEQRSLDPNDRAEQSMDPWQDVAVQVTGLVAKDVAQNFMDRWEFVRGDVVELIGDGFRNGMPPIPKDLKKRSSSPPSMEKYMPSQELVQSLTPGGYPSLGSMAKCKIQVVRSLGSWSGGLKQPETSIYQAWITAINSAMEYIYVEQQYFTSNMGEGKAKNRIAEAILNRVTVAVIENRPFQVYVVIPEHTTVPINYYTRRTLIQDSQQDKTQLCLMSRIGLVLQKAAPDSIWHGATAESVLSVCSLNSVGKSSSGRWDVNNIFVHSKVLVVDDRIAVVGSANANDRSFTGNGDSELGVIIWDAKADENTPVGAVKEFRQRVWRQFLGLPVDGSRDILDPSSKESFGLWANIAAENRDIISSVFDWTPRDAIGSLKEYNKLKSRYDKMNHEEKGASLNDPDRLEGVKGQLVIYPPKFLSDQSKKSFLTNVSEVVPFIQAGFL